MNGRILFVCTYGRDRSGTAVDLYHGLDGLDVRNAGIAKSAAIPLSSVLVDWADIIVCMQPAHRAAVDLFRRSLDRKVVRVLHVPNTYHRGDRELKITLVRLMLDQFPNLPVPYIAGRVGLDTMNARIV